MIRRIIIIDKEKCNGCGACVEACHEGAIGLEDGKAVLLRDDYCDGLGDCLPACPTDAIRFEEREALPYDEAAVLANMEKKKGAQASPFAAAPAGSQPGCPGSRAKLLESLQPKPRTTAGATGGAPCSHLRQWPVQIQLAPPTADFFAGADLLIAADCTAFAHGDFHARYMRDKITLIGCPKLDTADYAEKLTAILKHNDIRSVTVARMSVPCCAGITRAVEEALRRSGKTIPVEIVTLSTNGEEIAG